MATRLTGRTRPRRCHAAAAGFTLVELLVVLGIVAALLGILLPVLGRARQAARSAACLANLQQWGQAFQMYMSGNRGRPPPSATARDATTQQWWELLAPYNGDVPRTLLCPEADEPRDDSPDPGDGVRRQSQKGGARFAWRAATYDAPGPAWVLRGDWRGSYGLNGWVLGKATFDPGGPRGTDWISYPPTQSDRVPLLGDCTRPNVTVHNSTAPPPPKDLQEPETDNNLHQYCLDRHRMAVNIVFLDGHAENVPLAALWRLKWGGTFTGSDVTVP